LRKRALLKGTLIEPTSFSLCFTSDGKTLACANDEQTLKLWDTATGKGKATPGNAGSKETVWALVGNGRTLVSHEVGVVLRDLTGRLRSTTVFGDERSSFTALAIAPNGKTLATADFLEGTIKLWDVAGLRRHDQRVRAWVKDPPGFSAKEAAEMRKRVAALARVASPDFGLSPSLSGRTFAPVPGAERLGPMLLTSHQIETSVAVLELVKLGPRAMPFLLQALDDKTPTKLVIQVGWAGVHGPHTVTVGEVCYVVLGQIVGRDYLAGRYFPSKHIDLIRWMWASDDTAGHLYRTLMRDYDLRRARSEGSVDGWGDGTDLQADAAMRLLYYFPRKSVGMIADRLSQLDVNDYGKDKAAWDKQRERNGVDSVDFIKAIAWCKEPAIRDALLDIFKRTTDNNVLLAVLPGLGNGHEGWIRQRLEALLDRLPSSEDRCDREGYSLLVALGRYGGKEAKQGFVRYLRNGSLQRRCTMCQVLGETRGEWAIELLGPMLTDKSTGYGGIYWGIPELYALELPVRLCDEAAGTLSKITPGLKFELRGKYSDLDRQIEVMRRQIAKKRS
jgi:hypothetical protein